MHEMSIATEIVQQVLRIAEEHKAAAVTQVEVQVGILRRVVPEALELAFRAAADGTVAAGAELVIHEEKLVAVCRLCDCLFCPDVDSFVCPQCGQADARIVSGNDIILKSLVCETADEVNAP